MAPELGLFEPIFHTHRRVIAMSMWRNADLKPLKKTGVLSYFGAQKSSFEWILSKLFKKIEQNDILIYFGPI